MLRTATRAIVCALLLVTIQRASAQISITPQPIDIQTDSSFAIINHPSNRSVSAGQSASFSISVSGVGSLSFQWQKRKINIAGATSPSYTTPATTTADNGATFRCVVSNSQSTVTSNAALLTVTVAPPSITHQPRDTTVLDGETASFAVTASGSPTLTYQWQRNGLNIGGATGTSYTTPAIVFADSGALFRCIVSNSAGTITSNNAILTVNKIPPVMTQQPRDTTVLDGQAASFLVTAAGSPTLQYQWQKNNVNIGGATGATYTIAATTFSDSGATFRCIVSNSKGTVTSNGAILSVNRVAPVIIQQPRDTTVFDGQTARFAVTVTGSPTLVFQWQKNNIDISGANSASYTTPSTVFADSGARFRCIVSNSQGTVISNSATLTLNKIPPVITQQPRDTTVVDGQAAAFSVTAGGSPLLVYQWQKNTIDISGATGASYITPATVFADSGAKFRCIVSNSQGTLVSNSAVLSVNKVAPSITQQPRDTTVLDGQPAQFAVTALGSPPVAYQWQKNNVNIAGATGATYITPATVFADSGAKFRCMVSNSQGTVISTNAILSVNKVAPSIVQQPRDTTILDGQTATFSVMAAGSPTLSYQWQKNNVNIGGATGTSYITPVMAYADSGAKFRCMVGNSQGTVISNSAVLSVNKIPPTIAQQPRDTTVLDGQAATFSLTAFGTVPLTYQWQKNGVNVGGANSASYTTPATVSADSGSKFCCVVSNPAGTITSTTALLSVHKSPPSITQQPRDTTVGDGQIATFSIAASGTPPLAYQWQKNNTNIGGATGASYSTPATVFADSGSMFRCIVSNAQGTVTSNNAILSVHKVAPSLTQQPRDTTVLDGQTAAFSVTATGSPTLAYQWQKNNTNIGGATNASYTTPATVFADSGATFRCLVSNSQGTVTSNNAILTVNKFPPIITQQPRDTTVLDGQTAAFNVAVTGSPALFYQWQKNNTNIGGATGASYATPPTAFVDSGSVFRCIVSNSVGTVTSRNAILSVNKVAPSITQQPRDTTVLDGQTAAFSIAVTGSPTLVYQWQKNNTNIGGATNGSYTTPATVIADSGSTFRCIVSNSQGTVTSNNGILRVKKIGPSIAQQPRDTTVLDGQTAAFSVIATGSPTLVYQWQKNNVNIGGATVAGYTTPATIFTDSGSVFRCIVSNAVGTVTSNGAVLSVSKVPPTITQQPRDTTVFDGQTAVFSVAATGSPTLTYQWQRNSVAIGGATSATYTMPATVFADSGSQFRCLVSNAQGTVTSNNAILSVQKVAPSVTQQPRDTTVLDGQTAAFSVTATGSPSLVYQWQKNSVNIGGANSAIYITPAAVFADSGSKFRCIVSNSQGSVTSNGALLLVQKVAPSVTQQPRDTTVLDGQMAAFGITVTGSPTLTYQWQKNNTNIGGATSASYTTPGTVFADSGSTFRCIVSNSQGTVTSNNAVLSVTKVAPAITQQPRDTTVLDGHTAAFTIIANGSPTLTYQWQKNNSNIGGATNASYTTPSTVFADSGSTFRCVVSNSQGTVTSNSAILSVNKVGPAITQQPRDTTVVDGETGTFTITASGSPTLAYQWQKNNVSIGGATSASYTTPATIHSDSGSTFRCIVGNSAGTVTSSAAILNVRHPSSTIVSDDFHTGTLNGALWTFVDPLGDATLSLTGANTIDALLNIALPGGTTHDLWTNGYQAPRLMQSANNVDFTVEAKFQSTFTGQYESEGIVVEQDANNVIRFDIFYDGANTNVFAASFIGGFSTPATYLSTVIGAGAKNPAYLRINRAGNTWTVSTSLDGTTFAVAGSFTLAFTVARVGVWGGNSGPNPAFTMICDYFFNNASPISPEDPVVLSAPAITQQPRDTTVIIGQTAAFTITATGTPTLVYQWQKNNVNVGGATSASYTTPGTVQADSGSTFRCIVSNALGTVTSNSAVLTVTPPTASSIISDDFHTGTLNGALWTYVNPIGDATLALTGANTIDALLNIAMPAGTAHDLWTNGYQAPRIMQNANNVDFTVEAKFQSVFTAQFESEGIVVEQDANNLIRFDIFYDGANTNVFASSFIGGFSTPTTHLNAILGSGPHNPAYLRIARTANSWTVSTSFDGSTFTVAGNFTLALTVSKVGVWGGTSGSTPPAFTMLCDYFFNTASRIVPEDPLPPSAPLITQQPTNQTANEGQTATFTIAASGNPAPAYQWQMNTVNIGGATNANYTTPATVFADSGAIFRCVVSNSQGTVTSNSAVLSINKVGPTITQQPRDTTVVTGQTAVFSVTVTGSATLAYQWQKNNTNIGGATSVSYTTPATVLADNGTTFRCIVSNFLGTVTSNPATLTVNSQPAGSFVSDDFHTGVLNSSLWTFINPNLPSTLSFTGVGTTDALLSIAIPAGGSGHDAWTGGNFAPRIMQSIGDGDFQAEVKFQSSLTAAYQAQGIIVQQDTNNYLRFDVLRSPTGIFAFSASIINGNPGQQLNVGVTGSNPMWLRVTRSANNWTMTYSTDSINYTTVGTYAQVLTVSKIGPFAANAIGSTSPAFTCLIDYFFNKAYPITPEDPLGPVITTQPVDQTVVQGATANFSLVAGGLGLSYQWQKNSVNIGGATASSYTTPVTVHADSGALFRCIVSNGAGTVTSNAAILNVLLSAPPSTIVSDDFHTGTLNGAVWTYVNPLADATVSLTGATTVDALLNIALPGGTAHDLWTNGYQVPRIMQNANNTDFTVEAKFQSTFTAQYESEGIVVEQDANNVIRFDIFFDGAHTNVFASSFVGGFSAPTTHLNAVIGAGPHNPVYLRINRTFNTWTVSTSFDGTTFTPAGNFTLAFTVAKVGVWGGNSGTNPAFTLLCDYFFNTASPIVPEDPVVLSAPGITQQPVSQAANEGQTATFTITANGSPSPAYQWQKNNVNVGGATNTSYTTPATVFADSGATFRCIVSNSQGTVTSNNAILSVNKAGPTIAQQPRDTTVLTGHTAAFSITVTGSPTLAYQWQKNNANIGGATASSYTTPATIQADSGATFRCIVSNALGTLTSNSAILRVTTGALPSTIVSDDFHTGTLNGSLWTYVNPLADATLSLTGANTVDALLSIALPGVTHDLWTNGYQVPRIMQNANNVDFTVEAKYQSAFTGQFQSEGIVVEQDASNVIRFDIYYDGANTNVFAASFAGGFGTPVTQLNATIGLGPHNPAYLRINRTGNTWTVSTSFDGTTFTTAGNFTLAFTVAKVGVWGGNAGASPAFTMLCDYFFNNASPIVPEDPVGGLVAKYQFAEGVGDTIHDVSGKGAPVDLSINKGEATTWTGGGLAVNMPSIISSGHATDKMLDALKTTNAMSIEVWLKPTGVTDTKQSRVMKFGSEGNGIEIMHRLSEDRSSAEVEASVHMGTAQKNADRHTLTATAGNAELTHIVLTRDPAGTTVLYLNGSEAARDREAGNFAGWKNSTLLLGGENAWLGEYKWLAVYNAVLSKEEVTCNFNTPPGTHVVQPTMSNAPTLPGLPPTIVAQEIPKEFSLYQNYPNPFNPGTTIVFDLPKDENVTLAVYNLLGQHIETLVSERRPAGRYTIRWNAGGNASGVYLYRITAGDFKGTKKLVVLK